MKLKRREIVTIALGVTAVAALIVWRATGSGAAGAPLAAANTIPGALARIDEHDRLQRLVAALGDELGIEIPRVSTGDQETSIRKDLNAKAQANGMQITSMRRLEGTSRRATRTAEPIEFRLELTGQFASVLGFIYSLENATLPYVVRDAHISSSKGGGSRGQASPSAGRSANPASGRPGPSAARAGGPSTARGASASARSGAARPSSSSSRGGGRSSNSAGMVRVTMRVQSYLFPEVALAEATQAEQETESKKDETAAPTEPQSPDEDMEADGNTESSENEPERTEEPTPKETATPMTLESEPNLRYETFSLDSPGQFSGNVRIMTVPGDGTTLIFKSQSEDH